uniref:DUF4142 domain-containing protein n=1 Tax=Pedobacter schmidteae TaxID=2201271 RepID=UPI000EB0EF1D|nr:DUF4142 domain-containing protein [Pedobacter schmidteae]
MKNLKNYAIATIAACCIAISGVSYKSPVKKNNTSFALEQDTLSTEQFFKQLAHTTAREINLSKLAKVKSKDSKIREYAIKVMDACILAYSDMKPFADVRNITLTDSATFVPDKSISSLKKVGNNAFEKKYLSMSVDDHTQAIALLEKGTLFGDTSIVSFASKQLKVFRKNLEEARFLLKSPGSKMATERSAKEVE